MTGGARLDLATLPPSVVDGRNVAFMTAAKQLLAEYDFRLVLAELIDTTPSVSLPALIRELSMEDVIEPGMAEDVVRRLLKRSYELHAEKGYISGVRKVLALLGVSLRWRQWFEQEPKGPPGTHKVVVYPNEMIFDGQSALLDIRVQKLIRRFIESWQRKSQFIAVQYGYQHSAALHPAFAARRSRIIRILSPQMGDAAFRTPIYAGGGAYLVRRIRVNAA